MVKASRAAVGSRGSRKAGQVSPVAASPQAARATIAQVVQQAEALMSSGQRDAALAHYQQWLATAQGTPGAHLVWFNLGTELSKTDHAAGEAAYREAIRIAPDFVQAWVNLGSRLDALGKAQEALSTWRHARELVRKAATPDPELERMALNNLGRVLEREREFAEAEQCLLDSLKIDGNQYEVLQHVIRLRQRQCKWPVWSPIPNIGANTQLIATSPMAMLSLADDPGLQLLAARTFVERTYRQLIADTVPLVSRASARHVRAGERLRIGYVSGDLCMHPVGLLLGGLLESHDRSRFEVHGYCWSPEDGSPQRQRLKGAFDRLTLIKGLSDRQAAERIAADGIDILIELQGLSAGARPAICAHRPSAVQVTWLGLIGTSGLPWIDYAVTDRWCVPEDDERFYSEKVIALPTVFQHGDRGRLANETPTRAAVGLPDDKFVFASFNNSYKLAPEMFATWMRVLHRVPNSVLWLLDDNPVATANLLEAAASHSLPRERIILAPRTSHAEYLARMPLADLFLDNHPYNAGATAADALWVGLPLLTMAGRTFISRMAASLVRTAGLPDFVVHSLAEFEEKAVALASEPAALANARATLIAGRTQSPLFDAPRFARELEEGLVRAWMETTGQSVPKPVATPARVSAISPRPARPSDERRLLVRGWRGINHSFALVNQQQLLELMREPGLKIFHEDLPTPLKSWHDGKVQAGFPSGEDAAIQALPSPDGGTYDAVFTLAAPFAPLAVRGQHRTAMFAVTELGPGENSFAAGVEDPGLYCRDASEFIVTPTRWSRDRLAEYGFAADRIRIVPHGVRTDLFRPLSLVERTGVRKQVGYQPDEFVFLNLGGMFWNKGPDLLIRAFAAVHRAAGSRRVRLLLKDQRGLYQQTADTILQQVVSEYPGFVTEEVRRAITVLPGNLKMGELRMVYGAADAYVSPYRAEGFNLPVLEAFACGLPVLATEGGATDDFMHVGRGVPVRSHPKMMEGIRTAPRRFREPDLDDLVEKMLGLARSGPLPGGQGLSPDVAVALGGWTWAGASERLMDLLDLRVPRAKARVA